MTRQRIAFAKGLLTAALVVAALWAAPAQAHHIRGIPHYTYSENYPSAPLFEEVHETDDHVLRMAYYEIPGTKALDLALYVKMRLTGKPFEGNVTFAVYGENEDPAKAHSVVAYRNKNNIYKAGWEYEHDGVYWVRVEFEDGGKRIVDVFKLQMGDPPVNYWYVGSAVAIVVVLIVAVAIIKRMSAGQVTGDDDAEGDTTSEQT